MARFLKSRDAVAGKAHDELIFVGTQKVDKPVIQIMDFDAENLEEVEGATVADCTRFLNTESVTWISVYGLHELSVIRELGEMFGIHGLALEDIINTGQRAKLEEYDDTLYLVLKLLLFDSDSEVVRGDQFSMVIGKNFLLTFHEKPIDLFSHARERIRRQKGRIRKSGPDYLAYAILDIIVDNYMVALEGIGSRIEDIEDTVLEDPDKEVVNLITRYKREVNYLRKCIRPARELVLHITKLDSDLIGEQTLPFWKDLLGLITQTTEVLDSYREMLSDHLNIYNASISNKLNEIMKVLTIFAAIFIPLTFIAGIYGTNFDYLPELHYKYSYFIFWCFMIIVAGTMLRFFRKKGWL
jgi:magnesium transporter